MTITRNPRPAKEAVAKAFNAFQLAAFTIGAEASHTINVAVQLQDARGQAVTQITQCSCYLSDNADGSTLTATPTTSAPAIGTNGVLLGITTTGKFFDVITNKSGQFDVNIVNTSAQNYYLVLLLPDGTILVSPIIAIT